MDRPRRIFLAPDKFKGTLSAAGAAAAMLAGASRALDSLPGTAGSGGAGAGGLPELVALPLADGGEGSLSALLALEPTLALCGARLPGATGRKRNVAFLHDGGAAFFESARLLSLRFPANRGGSVLDRTSTGLGVWHTHARGMGLHQLHLFLGGTAVCDGGFGAFLDLGFQFADRAGRAIVTLRDLPRASRMTVPTRTPSSRAAAPATVELLSDVRNPLTGPRGAARLFGPQKGALPADVELLESALGTLARLASECVPDLPDPLPAGVGAGGGIALPFLALYPQTTRLSSGTEFFLSRSGLAELIEPGDIVITGEGRTDSGTLEGKLVDGVVHLCRAKQARCLIVSGSKSDEAELQKAAYPQIMAASRTGQAPRTSREAAALLAGATAGALLTELPKS